MGSNSGPNVIEFTPRRAKQIWIIAREFPFYYGVAGHCFSIGEVEVRDPDGNDLALISRGSGVQVSSTQHGFGMDRYTQDMLWPIQYDPRLQVDKGRLRSRNVPMALRGEGKGQARDRPQGPMPP